MKRLHLFRAGWVLVLGGCLAASPVFAQASLESRAMMDRINELEAQVRDMSRKSFSAQGYNPGEVTTTSTSGITNSISNTGIGTPSAPPITNFTAPDPESRLNTLEAQMRELNGQVERANFQAQQNSAVLQKLNNDLEMRFQQLEQRQAMMMQQSPQVSASNAPMTNFQANAASGNTPGVISPVGAMIADSAPPPNSGAVNQDSPATPEELYNRAYSEMQRKEYDDAIKDFKSFLASNPGHKLAPNAQYWLGEIYYSQANYKLASATFADGYQKFPKSTKAADNLLKLGLSLEQQNRTKDACTVLRQLSKDFAGAPETVTSNAARGIKRMKCA